MSDRSIYPSKFDRLRTLRLNMEAQLLEAVELLVAPVVAKLQKGIELGG